MIGVALDIARRWVAGAWGYVLVVVFAIGAIAAMLFRASRAGRDEAVADQQRQELDDVHKAGEVERDVATSKPDAVRERLRRYERD